MNALVDHFMRIMDNQPLSLALCVMNLLLLYFLFRQGNQFMQQRHDTATRIVEWQRDVQTIMANCVSAENLKIILEALERDRELYRAILPTFRGVPIPEPPLPPDISKP